MRILAAHEFGAHAHVARHARNCAEWRRTQDGAHRKLGADGLARRSCFVSPAWRTGPPPIHSSWTDTRRNRMARPASRRTSHGAACGFGSRASGPTRAHGSRNRPLERPGSLARPAQGWAGHSRDRRRWRFTAHRTPALGVNSPCWVARWANRKCSIGFTSLAPLRRRAARGSSAHRTRPWPRCHSLPGWSAVFLKPPFRAQHERPGFPTANDHIERPLGRAGR